MYSTNYDNNNYKTSQQSFRGNQGRAFTKYPSEIILLSRVST